MGIGHGIYAGVNAGVKPGSRSVVDFRTLVAGIGISIQTDVNSLTITNTQSLPNLGDLAGLLAVKNGGTGVATHPTNGIIVGNGASPVAAIDAPTVSGTSLHWNGTAFEWKAPSVTVDAYTKTEVDTLLSGIPAPIDAYTKPEVDSLIAGLPVPVDAYTKPEVDALIAGIPEPIDTYTKLEISDMVDNVMDYVQNLDFYTKEEVNALLAGLSSGSNLPLIRKPVNLYPQDQEEVAEYEYILEESVFRDVYQIGHAASHYVVSEDPMCVEPYVLDVTWNLELGDQPQLPELPSLMSVEPEEVGYRPTLERLQPAKTYYWKVRQQDLEGLWSEWSNVTMFTTSVNFGGPSADIVTPVVLFPFNNRDLIPVDMIMLGSDYEVNGDYSEMAYSEWEIDENANGYINPPLVIKSEPGSTSVSSPHGFGLWVASDPTETVDVVPAFQVAAANGLQYSVGYTTESNKRKANGIWVSKHDSWGDERWSILLDNTRYEGPSAVVATSSDLLIATEIVDGDVIKSCIIKIEGRSGEVMWAKEISFSSSSRSQTRVSSLQVDWDDSIYLGGDIYTESPQKAVAFVAKYDSAMTAAAWFNVLSTEENPQYSNRPTDVCLAVHQSNREVYLTMNSYQNGSIITAMKINRTGSIVARKTFGGGEHFMHSFSSTKCTLGKYGDLTISSNFSHFFDYGDGNIEEAPASTFIAQFDLTTDEMYWQMLVDISPNYQTYLVPGDDGMVYAVSTFVEDAVKKMFVAAYTTSGSIAWNKKISESNGTSLNVTSIMLQNEEVGIQACMESHNKVATTIHLNMAGDMASSGIGLLIDDLYPVSNDMDFVIANGALTYEPSTLNMLTKVYTGSTGVYATRKVEVALRKSATYRCRCRYHSVNGGVSEWSEYETFYTELGNH